MKKLRKSEAAEATACLPFAELTVDMLYDILALRARVFAVEQQSAYLDPDGYDKGALHLMHFDNKTLTAYARILPPGSKFPEASVGRLVVHPDYRSQGLGGKLMREALHTAWETHGKVPILIEAQAHLKAYYESIGYHAQGEVYDLDGIPHIKMRILPDQLT